MVLYYFTSDVMYNKYKRLVYTSPDMLARFCKLIERKKFGLICFPTCTVIKNHYGYAIFQVYIQGYQVDVRLISLLAWTVCKLFFFKFTQPFHQKSHECALKLTDFWNTSLQLFDLNYKFAESRGASLLALAKSIYYKS